MKIETFPLGELCTDSATGLEGRLTHWAMNMSGNIQYIFQPRGLNAKGAPFSKLVVCQARVKGLSLQKEEVPFEVLGSEVTDEHSGFTGTAIYFKKHVNGCFHVHIQPKGIKGGELPEEEDFDLRDCSGEMIKALSDKEKRESQKQHPSPTSGSKREFG